MIGVDTVRNLLEYDPASGVLTWRFRPKEMFQDVGCGGAAGQAARWNGRYAGRAAFTAEGGDGYLVGATGVYWSNRYRKWEVRLNRDFVGYFWTKDAAIAARQQAQNSAGYHQNHGRKPHANLKGMNDGQVCRN